MQPPGTASGIDSHRKYSPHPVVFFFLVLPFGVSSGYYGVTLAYLFSQKGITVEQIAQFLVICGLPQIVKFFWAPLVDSTWRLKKWYLMSLILIVITTLLLSVIPFSRSTYLIMTITATLCSVAGAFMSAAYDGLTAHATTISTKGRAGGYIQAGNIGGVSLGGGAGIWLAGHLASAWMSGAILAAVCLLCSPALLFVREPESTVQVKSSAGSIVNVLRDIWQTLTGKLGLTALVLSLIPIGTGAASNLFAPMATEWHAGADLVALATGFTGGLVTIAGCLSGGWICDRMKRQSAYLLFGILLAIAAIGMAVCPRTPWMYIFWTMIYSFIGGLSYAGFTAYALEAVGTGAAASKMEIYTGISNIPIYTMIWVEGLADTRWKASGALLIEAFFALVSALMFVALGKLVKSFRLKKV